MRNTCLSGLVLIVALFISGCGPSYHLARDYVPPASAAGMQCLSDCSSRNHTCVRECNQTQSQCVSDARLVAQDNLAISMDGYNEDTHAYLVNMEIYNVKLEAWDTDRQRIDREVEIAQLKCERNPDVYHAWCEIWDQRKMEYQQLREPEKPVKPVRPTLASDTARLQRACNSECGCAGLYDKCYLGCGGQIVNRKVCTSGCD